MIAEELIKYLEGWAPPGAAWSQDNVGLQIGSRKTKIKNVFLCLELTKEAAEEAVKNHCNFIFTHHPLLFNPLKNLDFQNNSKAKLIEKVVKNDLVVYSAHTNLDFTKDGVSFELAKVLKLNNIRFLKREEENQFKLVVFVPNSHVEKISNAIFDASGGIIGEYSKCSFRTSGTGTFKGSDKSNPVIGKRNSFEYVDEIRLEVLVNSWHLNKVITAMLKVHPYEEPAYDIYPLKNENSNYGFGAVGELQKSLSPKEFLSHVCKSLKAENVRYAKGKNGKIKKVAVCGGSGTDLLNAAIDQKADAFITADIKYHTFQDGENKILFIDAGHYETEVLVLNIVKKKMEKFINKQGESLEIIKFKRSTNPVKFFNNKGVK